MTGAFTRVSPERSEAIADAVRAGQTIAAVAREFGLSPVTVRTHARRHGAHKGPQSARRSDVTGEPPGYWSATPDVSPELARAAARKVCAHATDQGEARDLLLMLGLGPILTTAAAP